MQIESTTHFHPQLASKAEKVFPIPLNRKTLLQFIADKNNLASQSLCLIACVAGGIFPREGKNEREQCRILRLLI